MGFIDEVILTRTSVRSFTGEAIPEATLLQIAHAGFSAPSAVNVQPWDLVIVTARGVLNDLCTSLPYAKMLTQAPAAFVICGNLQKDEVFAAKYWIQDCSAMTENILLAAHALGLGAVWTAVYPETERVIAVRHILAIPEDRVPLCVVPVGLFAGTAPKPKNKFDPAALHRDRW